MKVAILGATGMLGSMLTRYLSGYFDVVVTARDGYYVSSAYDVELGRLDVISGCDKKLKETIGNCQWVINAIGAIPQRCNSRFMYYLLNESFPQRLAWLSQKLKFKVIQIATDCVYSYGTGNYDELCEPNPIDDYGKSKLWGEVKSPNMYHLRCSIIGREPLGSYSLLGWFLSQPQNATISGYTNHIWNGITTLHFAKVCRGIISNNLELPHIHHLVPVNSCSKYELLKLFASEFNREDITIQPVDAPNSINRTLSTINPELNRQLWQKAGYAGPPAISQMVKELAEYLR